MNKGDVIIIPTDTVYGLACMLYDEKALERIFMMKGRDQAKQIPVLVSGPADIVAFALCNQDCRVLIEAFWPGALTIVLPATAEHRRMTNEETVAVRMPKNSIVLDLLRTYGPMRATSLNKSGEPPLSDLKQINETFGHLVNAVYDAGTTALSHVASTVVSIIDHHVTILRAGTITEAMIKEVLEIQKQYR